MTVIGSFLLSACALAAPAENVAPGFTISGSWTYSNVPNHAPGKITIYAREPAAAAVWNPQIKSPGKYRVSFFNPAHAGSDPQANVAVVHAGAVDQRRIDQSQEPPQWITLGEFAFAGQGAEYVRLTPGKPSRALRAAAVKFEFLGAPADNLWANLVMDDVSAYDPARFAPKPLPYTDVKGHWAENHIRAVAGQGLLAGATPQRFEPDAPIAIAQVRAAFEKLAGKAAKFSASPPQPSAAQLVALFVDAARSSGKNLEWAKPDSALGLVAAGEAQHFQTPKATRAQAAALLDGFGRNILRSGPPAGAAWELTFDDEFSGADLDWTVWKSAQGETWGRLLSTRFKENVAVGDGLMRLVARKEKRGGKEWTSAFVSTKTFRQTYGYWESRFRYAGASGLNNAFWTRPDASYEIDVNEGHFPNIVNSTLHQQGLPSSTTRYLAAADLAQDFHVYGMEWTEKEIIFYFDGREIGRKPNVKAHTPGPVMFSTAVFGAWTGPLTDALDGKSMDVDWVRVYRRKSP